jgi:hypothetical protein
MMRKGLITSNNRYERFYNTLSLSARPDAMGIVKDMQ